MNKKILTLSVLSLLLFSMFLGFVDAAEKSYDKKVGSDCERGLIGPWLMGTNCGSGLVCNINNKCEAGSNIKSHININLTGKVPNFLEGLLNSGKNGAVYDRLIIFVLVVSVVFGVLGSVNIFGGEEEQSGKGTLINLIISVTVGLAGVRFLPENLISSITAPATAMVSLITAGIPFLIIHVMTGKLITNGQAGSKVKTIWVIYLLLICGLIFNSIRNLPAGPQRMIPFIVLGVFGVLAIMEFIVTPLRIRRSHDNKLKRIHERADRAKARTEAGIAIEKANEELAKARFESAEGKRSRKEARKSLKKTK